MFKYFPHTPTDIKQMLEVIGVDKMDDLFKEIDPKLYCGKEFNLPNSLSEFELRDLVKAIGNKNKVLKSYLGAGAYDVFNIAAIKALVSRQEFLTSYTPYQPEISQGTLQYIFEFQSMICELTQMDIANASMYDGATATAEAMFVVTAQTKRNTVLISSTVNPRVIEVVRTYAKYRGLRVEIIPHDNYQTSIVELKKMMNDDIAGVIVSQPNYYGVIEDFTEINEITHDNKSLLVMNVDPSTLPVLKSPKAWGADIVCGEAQSLGIPLSFGGPYVGFLACKNALLRKMPGRICGITNDIDGKRGFVLTFQAREQHIRREKANSNICSNQSLNALFVTIYMSLMGKTGMKDVAMRAYNNAHYLHDQLISTGLFKNTNNHPFFKEFVLEYDGDVKALNEKLLENGILGGLELEGNKVLLCATETKSKLEIDEFVRLVGELHVR